MNIVITWPRSRTLDDYLTELRGAVLRGEVINFRVPSKPKVYPGDRCYIVHDGAVRGWNEVIEVRERDEVRNVKTGGTWPHGIYIVRDPRWLWLPEPFPPMRGFQGWRYARDLPT